MSLIFPSSDSDAKAEVASDGTISSDPVASFGVSLENVCCPSASSSVASSPAPSLWGWAKRIDWLFVLSLGGCIIAYVSHFGFHVQLQATIWGRGFHDVYTILNTMLPGLILGILAFGLVGNIPKELVVAALGPRGKFKGILRASLAGLLLDVCNHGVVLIGLRLYERGASAAQMVAFLVASPWNSLSLTIILLSLVGWPLTMAFFFGSFLMAIISGLVIDKVQKLGFLPDNPHAESISEVSFRKEIRQYLSSVLKIRWSLSLLLKFVRTSFLESSMIVRWLLLGVIISAAVRNLLTPEQFTTWLGPSLLGLLLTMVAATIIEVCSEGSIPIAADLVNRAGAPGNAFAFMMAGVSTDATEILGIKEVTKSWKISLMLPIVTLPQVILLSWLLNVFTS